MPIYLVNYNTSLGRDYNFKWSSREARAPSAFNGMRYSKTQRDIRLSNNQSDNQPFHCTTFVLTGHGNELSLFVTKVFSLLSPQYHVSDHFSHL